MGPIVVPLETGNTSLLFDLSPTVVIALNLKYFIQEKACLAQ